MDIERTLNLLAKNKKLVVTKDQANLILQLLKMVITKHTGKPTIKDEKGD